MKFIFFGAGYCSRFILPKLDSSSKIICTHNLEIKEQAFDKDLKIKRLTFSEFLKKKDNFFRGTTHILNSIPPLKNNDLIYDLLKNSKNKVFKDLKWFGYFSSTSVYGDHSGHWVDEETKIKPLTIRGINRKEVEDLYLKLFQKNKFPSHIFRLPGIYGPGRSAIDKLLNGKNLIIKKPNQFFSRIFVEDIATAILSSMNKPTPGQIYNITDNFPCSAEIVTKYAAKLLNVKELKFLDLNSTEVRQITREFYKDNKRVSNKKIKKILGWTPKFENYKLGLQDILKELNG